MISAFCPTMPPGAGSRSASPLFFSCAKKFLLGQVVRKSLFIESAFLVRPPIRNIIAFSGEHIRVLKVIAGKAIVLIPSIVHGSRSAGINVGPNSPNLVQIVSLFDGDGIHRLIQICQIFLVELRAIGLHPGFPSGRYPLPFSVKRGPVKRGPDLLCVVKVEKIALLINIRFGGASNNTEDENNGQY